MTMKIGTELSQAGYRCFTTADAFRGYIQREILAEPETEEA